MEPVGDAQLGHTGDDVLHHVTIAGQHETHIGVFVQDQLGGLHKVIRSLLEGDTAQEGDDLLFHELVALHLLVAGNHSVVQGIDFAGVDAVFLNHDVAGEVADGTHGVGGGHALALHVIDDIVAVVLARTVVFRGVDVHHQRFAAHALGRNARAVGEPVVRMDDVELLVARNLRGNLSIAVYLLHQILAVTSAKDVFALPIVAFDETAVNLVHHIVVVVQPHIGHQAGVDLDV